MKGQIGTARPEGGLCIGYTQCGARKPMKNNIIIVETTLHYTCIRSDFITYQRNWSVGLYNTIQYSTTEHLYRALTKQVLHKSAFSQLWSMVLQSHRQTESIIRVSIQCSSNFFFRFSEPQNKACIAFTAGCSVQLSIVTEKESV